ncbi:beta-galactosidase [Tessaracoccus palaemonis]|uniref:Beta-galactosidase n=1 Tax=Tessaracoccus palaemonis TaxID=2829499 RepID=A0ABX8SG60_9ACTN|nr:beta-galactosidase [Tessaracoccus palaemonis]QXT61944.1 beta-galactosidase [Tessaracoccus palaemonis]
MTTNRATNDRLLYGAAYYEEYLPCDRVEADAGMMRDAGLNVVRIAESTWSSLEPQPGVFDLSHVDKALETMAAAGMKVIVGTPTYAVPAWLVASHPEVLAETSRGEARYGARQIMDITSPAYLFHAERAMRALLSHVADHPAVIGFQVDNETKYYDTASVGAQRAFVKHLKARFDGDLGALNDAFGLAYWSNRVDAWEDFPDVRGTINGSLGAAWDEFRRSLVDNFLGWQAGIVREYAREDQFVTQNFDFDWAPGWSYGLQPAVNHFTAARTVDLAGVDIYHPTQSQLTGREIAFGGDMTRSIKGGANYLVLETQAQGQMGWLPYPGQLRLHAYSHLASGADGVMYWHWHSLHNSFETYWKGLLSHDFETNPTYDEAAVVGREWAEHSPSLLHLRKANRVAVMVSNEALTALKWFTLETGFPEFAGPSATYNDVLRWVYDALFDLNVEVDFVPVDADLSTYDVLLTPALYTASEETLASLRAFVERGGHLVSTLRTAVADEHVKVWHDRAPHALTDVFGMTYNQFTRPDGALIAPGAALAPLVDGADQAAGRLLELLVPRGADVLAGYDHPAWSDYAAVTRNRFGDGTATYVATVTSPEVLRGVLELVLREAGLWSWPQDLAGTVTVRRGTNGRGREITYLLNYSGSPVTIDSPVAGTTVLDGVEIAEGAPVTVDAWDLAIIES